MIHHLSIPAVNPRHVADVLAELMGGPVTRFGPNPNSYVAWAADKVGTAFEIFPLGTEMKPGAASNGADFSHNANQMDFGATHVALSVTRSKAEVITLAEREGWRALELSRGSFRVIEFWIENHLMLEVMPPDMASEYLAATQFDSH